MKEVCFMNTGSISLEESVKFMNEGIIKIKDMENVQ